MNTELRTIVDQLARLAVDLDKAVERLAELEVRAIDAERDYKVAFAREFREAAGSVEDRRQAATEKTADLWRTCGLAASAVRLQKEHIKALHARLDVGRTLSANARAEAGLAGMGGTP